MPTKKKVVRKPIEKLSEREQIEVIEDSSSSDEDFDEIPPPTPPPTPVEVAPAKVKKPPSEKQLAYYKKMRERAAEKRKAKSTEAKAAIDNAINEMDISTHPVKAKPIVEEDPDDKFMTKKEMKKYLASQKEEAPAPAQAAPTGVVVKPKRKYTKRAKKEPAAPTGVTQSPAPVKNPIVSQSSMMFV